MKRRGLWEGRQEETPASGLAQIEGETFPALVSLVPGREWLEGKWKINVEFAVALGGGRRGVRMEVMRKAELFIFLHAAWSINVNSCIENCTYIYNT